MRARRCTSNVKRRRRPTRSGHKTLRKSKICSRVLWFSESLGPSYLARFFLDFQGSYLSLHAVRYRVRTSVDEVLKQIGQLFVHLCRILFLNNPFRFVFFFLALGSQFEKSSSKHSSCFPRGITYDSVSSTDDTRDS